MTVLRMDHVGIVVEDLQSAIDFFRVLGLELEGEGSLEGGIADQVTALDGVRSDIAMLRTSDGSARIELSKFHKPASPEGGSGAPANAIGIRHVSFAVDDIDEAVSALQSHGAKLVGEIARYEDYYRLCYMRGPEGIIVELAQKL